MSIVLASQIGLCRLVYGKVQRVRGNASAESGRHAPPQNTPALRMDVRLDGGILRVLCWIHLAMKGGESDDPTDALGEAGLSFHNFASRLFDVTANGVGGYCLESGLCEIRKYEENIHVQCRLERRQCALILQQIFRRSCDGGMTNSLDPKPPNRIYPPLATTLGASLAESALLLELRNSDESYPRFRVHVQCKRQLGRQGAPTPYSWIDKYELSFLCVSIVSTLFSWQICTTTIFPKRKRNPFGKGLRIPTQWKPATS